MNAAVLPIGLKAQGQAGIFGLSALCPLPASLRPASLSTKKFHAHAQKIYRPMFLKTTADKRINLRAWF